ncbi:hypothetical protein GCM10011581_46440 [Saccharopolyspora subtropica]|uniref:Uncharacterized protein n=1 Tax=Saccharopolyspora thermophila TaxID=89367 RepID=A0A917K7S4_9PSEU|nr:hypothetical protein GCM10011581_46440 [Saccharopolyspora subtropica]
MPSALMKQFSDRNAGGRGATRHSAMVASTVARCRWGVPTSHALTRMVPTSRRVMSGSTGVIEGYSLVVFHPIL